MRFKRFFLAADIIFILFMVLAAALPSAENAHSAYLIRFVLLAHAVYICMRIWGKNAETITGLGDALTVVYIFLLLWELATSKFARLAPFLYPKPGVVIKLFIEEVPDLLKGLASSAGLLAGGFFLALIAAVPLGLYFGYKKRLKLAARPFAKVLGPIPPIVYIPYAIAILPTFRAASTFIIFLGAFWPIFINTLNGVSEIDKKIMDSARMLKLNDRRMLLHVILPGTVSAIMSGATIGLSFSFILLTSAEMIGATNGMGWYVKYFSDFADYPRVIVGIVFIGIVVTAIMFFFDKLEKYLLRWRKT